MASSGCSSSTSLTEESPPRTVSPPVSQSYQAWSNQKLSVQAKKGVHNVCAQARKDDPQLPVRAACRKDSELTGVSERSVFRIKLDVNSGTLKSSKRKRLRLPAMDDQPYITLTIPRSTPDSPRISMGRRERHDTGGGLSATPDHRASRTEANVAASSFCAPAVRTAAKRSGDYHTEMDAPHFEKWSGEQLLPIIKPSNVTVMDNAHYHSVRLDNPPSPHTRHNGGGP
ncbi:hypothetical protein HPB50_023164 [Hyalomma asiaticum]|uniref:Uncharacterized protein n=1 Tax=Hyalomma asiaticum TaxID=266040 RepID=A0ACB7TBA1_HYAAI|nr:hypothetical protein HPB50_023164 [Hyalomma asiaticum]